MLRQNWSGVSVKENTETDAMELSMFCRACVNETNEMNSYPLDFTEGAKMGDESLRQILEKVLGFELDTVN